MSTSCTLDWEGARAAARGVGAHVTTRHTEGMARRRAPQVQPRRRLRQLPDFTHLPDRVLPEEVTTAQDVDPGRDPRGGRNPERDFMLRYGAGL
jgi:hypothetical protein